MRYIDADSFFEEFEELDREPYNNYPTADVRENIKGCWAPHPDKSVREFDVCTACGIGCKRREYGKNDDGTEWMTEYSFPYCPNCGAEMMRGEADD